MQSIVSKTLRHLIIDRKVSKTDFAKHLGVARSTLDAYLNGKTQMPADRIMLAARYFDVPVGYLFGENNNDIANNKSIIETLKQQQKQINKLEQQLKSIANSLQKDF